MSEMQAKAHTASTRFAKRSGRVQSIAARLPTVLLPAAKRFGFAEGDLVSQWHTLCPAFAQHCQPLSLRRGTLYLGVASASAQANLTYWLPTLTERINMYYGYAAVTRIVFKQVRGTIKHTENKG